MDTATLDTQVAPLNPWLTIWFQPRRTVRYLVSTDPERLVWTLAALNGVAGLHFKMRDMQGDDSWPILLIVPFELLVGSAIGATVLFIGAKISRVVGALLGGEGTEKEVRTALAWAGVPTILQLLLVLAMTVVAGRALHDADPSAPFSLQIGLFVFGGLVLRTALDIWSIVISVVGLSEVHRYSVGRAILTLLAPILLVIVIAYTLKLLFW